MKTKKKIQWDIQNSAINYKTLYEQIADSIEKMILDNGIAAQRLPPEFDLVKEYGVSRSVIREALKVLKERGLVSMRAGDGSYVTLPGAKAISGVMARVTQFNGISDDKINEVRTILETKAVGDAAVYATEKDIANLETIVEQMETCKDDIAERARKDCEFHFAIASLSQNALLVFMVESLLELLTAYIEIRLQADPEGNAKGIRWHRKIVKAIKSHDSKLAEKYMRQHLAESFYQAPVIADSR
jgi:GntR family transcriptional repressor for pyruvate dehydrogenase complex